MANIIPRGIDDTTGQAAFAQSGDSLVDAAGNPISNLVFIEKKEITSATTSTTFSGLDGNTDGLYYLSYYWINGNGSASQTRITLQPNGLSTNQTGTVASLSTTYSAGSITELRLLQISSTTGRATGHAWLWAPTTGPGGTALQRGFMSSASVGISTPGGVRVESAGGWNETSTNITSLVVTGNIGSDLGVGSTFTLYKMAI